MGISNIVKYYLDLKGVPFDLKAHPITGSTSHQTAIAANIEDDHIAKAVLLKRDWEYLMVVVPADKIVRLDSFEAGNHEHLFHVNGVSFQYMFDNFQHGNFSTYFN
tara:strand:+ start:40895 stop:41212 length:318 start_codon:yes stop_codon:yes gene_type:complete